MTGSALFGQPPNTESDYWIVRSILHSAGLNNVDPERGAKIPPPRPSPAQYHFETKGPGIIAGMSVSIVIMVAITGSRLLLRLFKTGLRWGSDDWLIIPGVVRYSILSWMIVADRTPSRQALAIAWPALQIAMVQYGGAGKHLYDVTYHEFYMFKWVQNPFMSARIPRDADTVTFTRISWLVLISYCSSSRLVLSRCP